MSRGTSSVVVLAKPCDTSSVVVLASHMVPTLSLY